MKSLIMPLLCSLVFLSACGESSPTTTEEVIDPPAPSADNGQAILDAAACDEEMPSTCVGAEMPSFTLEDFQPASPYMGETYGLDRFHGKVTYVSLWAAWCGYCRSQATQMASIHQDLIAMGVDVNVVAINTVTGVDAQPLLADTCSFPLLQDVAFLAEDEVTETNAWSELNGGKDDMYIYDAEGKLLIHLPAHGAVETHLSTPQGYANVRDALLAAAPPVNTPVTEDTQDSP